MCNDFGNRVPYDDYLRAFSQTRMWRGDLSEKAATIRMRTPVSRRSHDYRDVIVAQERLGFLFVVARQSELVLIVALAGGRPGPRLRSRAVRRR